MEGGIRLCFSSLQNISEIEDQNQTRQTEGCSDRKRLFFHSFLFLLPRGVVSNSITRACGSSFSPSLPTFPIPILLFCHSFLSRPCLTGLTLRCARYVSTHYTVRSRGRKRADVCAANKPYTLVRTRACSAPIVLFDRRCIHCSRSQ